MNRSERRRLQKMHKEVEIPKTYSLTGAQLLDRYDKTVVGIVAEELRKQMIETNEDYVRDLDVSVLWALHRYYGWGVKRLHDFYIRRTMEYLRLSDFYLMDDLYLETKKLTELGCDLDAWSLEAQELYRIEKESQ